MIHKHICVSALVKNPIIDKDRLCDFLRSMAEDVLDMKIVAGPVGAYVDDAGNRGPTATVCISTSHLAIHIWDELSPAHIEFDIYSCKDFSIDDVIEKLHKDMEVFSINVQEIHRGQV